MNKEAIKMYLVTQFIDINNSDVRNFLHPFLYYAEQLFSWKTIFCGTQWKTIFYIGKTTNFRNRE